MKNSITVIRQAPIMKLLVQKVNCIIIILYQLFLATFVLDECHTEPNSGNDDAYIDCQEKGDYCCVNKTIK